jgi:hypothetical protein
MANALIKLIKIARKLPMSESEAAEQRIRFSYGSAKIENDKVTEEMVREAAKKIANQSKLAHG